MESVEQLGLPAEHIEALIKQIGLTVLTQIRSVSPELISKLRPLDTKKTAVKKLLGTLKKLSVANSKLEITSLKNCRVLGVELDDGKINYIVFSGTNVPTAAAISDSVGSEESVGIPEY